MRLRRAVAAALSFTLAAGPVSAGQRSVVTGIGAMKGGVVLPNVPALSALSSTSLPPVVVPNMTVTGAPIILPQGASTELTSDAQALKTDATTPRAVFAAPGEKGADVPRGVAEGVGAVVEQLAQKPEAAPAALSNLYDGRVGKPVDDGAVSAAGAKTPMARLARWARRPAVRTAASLAAAASPFLILAAKAKEAAAPLYSNMDPEWLISSGQAASHGPAAVAAAWVGGVLGLAAGVIVGNGLTAKLKDRPLTRGAANALLPVVAGLVVAGAAALVASFSPVMAAVALSAAVLSVAAQSDAIAPLTRWREAHARRAGLFDLVEKDGKTYLDLKPEQLGRLHMLSGAIERGLGEKNLATNTQWDFEFAFYFRRSGDRVELMRKNTLFRAPEGSALHNTISRGVPDTVIASAELKEIDGRLRVDAGALFVADFFSLGIDLDVGYESAYTLNKELSGLIGAKLFSKNLELMSRLSFTRGDAEYVKTHFSDTRRVDLDVRYSLSALPEEGYRPRKATPLIGHFTTVFEDWSDDQKPELETFLVNRWRLEKSDPTQASSPVKKPIVYWIDKTIPKEYHAAIARGALKWNKAFERLGLLGAIEVRSVEDDASFDPSDITNNMISYRFERDSPFALGNSRANPLTGEIYHAHVTIVPEHARSAMQLRFREIEAMTVDASEGKKKRGAKTAAKHEHHRGCRHGEQLASEASMMLALMEARGGLTPERRRELIEGYMQDLVMHEIGHTLGLRHNFVAKNWLKLEETSDTGVFSASVMDYYPLNLASREEKQGELYQTELGPYDYLAIEYAYKPLDAATEEVELAKIAARTSEPGLEYLTDEDLNFDPRAQHNTLGDDVVKYAGRRVSLTRELWEKLEADAASGQADHQAAYRKWVQGWLGYDMGVKQVASVVGGVYFHRTAGGAPKGRLSYEPVPADEQRRALAFLAANVFSDEPFAVSPELLRSLAARRYGSAADLGEGADLTHFSHDALIERLRRNVLNVLLDEERLVRLSDSAKLVPAGEDRLTIQELFSSLADASFGELASGGRRRKKGSRVISPMRKRLQDIIVSELLPYLDEDGDWPLELRVPARVTLIELQRRIGSALKSGAWDAESRAHLTELSRRVRKGLTPSRD